MKTMLVHPLTYVLLFAVGGAASIVAGVAVVAGAGWAFITAGVLLIAGSAFVAKGMSANG